MLATLRTILVPVEDAVARYSEAKAVVAVILRERDGAEVLVMERAARSSDPWSGHWSFPGGRRHPGEPLLETAYRETEEEVGLSLRDSEVLGCIEARAPANRPELLVLPFVFAWSRTDEPTSGPEVASVAWVPFRELETTRGSAPIRFRGGDHAMPAFIRDGRTIWGFTYRVLEDLLALVTGPASRP